MPRHTRRDIMGKYRTEMKKYYYDPARYKTCLEQSGITYPTVRAPGTSPTPDAPASR